MPDDLSETVVALYRRHAGQWDAARRASVWNDRGWREAFGRGSRVLDLGCGVSGSLSADLPTKMTRRHSEPASKRGRHVCV